MRARSQTTHVYPDDHEFFRYTSGRWIWDEEKHLSEHYRKFNVTELQKVAAKSILAESCVELEKLAEGAHNKVFKMIMNDGRAVIASVPHPNAGPPVLTTASEVATLEFVSPLRPMATQIKGYRGPDCTF